MPPESKHPGIQSSSVKTMHPEPKRPGVQSPSVQTNSSRAQLFPYADRTVHTKYCFTTVKIKYYNVMIDGQNVFNQLVKNNLKTYDNVSKIVIG